jgi:hypothetical protein
MIIAIAVLHNIAIDRNTPLPPNYTDDEEDDEDGARYPIDCADREGQQVRDTLVRMRFT